MYVIIELERDQMSGSARVALAPMHDALLLSSLVGFLTLVGSCIHLFNTDLYLVLSCTTTVILTP